MRPSAAELFARAFAAAFALASVALLLIGAVGPASWQVAIAEHGPSCFVHRLTGIDCPFCGMTHATLALGAGDWHRAFALHPLAPFVLAGALFLFVTVAIGRTRSLLVGRRPAALLATIAVVWIVRLAA